MTRSRAAASPGMMVVTENESRIFSPPVLEQPLVEVVGQRSGQGVPVAQVPGDRTHADPVGLLENLEGHIAIEPGAKRQEDLSETAIPQPFPQLKTARASRATPCSRFPSSPTKTPRRRARPRASPRAPASSPSGSRRYPAGCRFPGRSMGKDCFFHLLARAKLPRSASSRHTVGGWVGARCASSRLTSRRRHVPSDTIRPIEA